MRNGLISIAITLFGVVLLFVVNNLTYDLFQSELARLNPNGLTDGSKIPEIKTKIGFGIFLGVVALYFAFRQYRENKWKGILVGLLAILLIYLDFVPFWEFQIGDAGSDINFG